MSSPSTRRPSLLAATLALTALLAACRPPTPASDPSATTITTAGGTVRLGGIAEATFPPGAFATPQAVRITTEDLTTPPDTLDDARTIYDIQTVASAQVVVSLGKTLPATDAFTLTLTVPDALRGTLQADTGLRAFALVTQENEDEVIDSYESLPSTYDPATHTIRVDFDTAWLTQAHTAGTYQAIVTLASVPGSMPPAAAALNAQAASTCKAKTIGSPLEGTPTVSGNPPRGFNPNPAKHPVSGQKKSHWGADLKAAQGSNVLAADDGVVKRVKFSGEPSTWPVYPKGGSGGQYIVIEHSDGSATKYMHLSGVDVASGTHVTKGQVIGQSGGTKGTPGAGGSTGPHLHFEYSPTGKIYNNTTTDKTDPVNCITEDDATGSIVVSDNGSANDDVFQVSLDGVVLGTTPKGGSDSFGVNNLRPGTKTLGITCLDDGGDVCTLGLGLGDGLTFADGSTSTSDALNLGQTASYAVTVPAPVSP